MTHDLVIRGALVVDGSGDHPSVSDVAVDDGRIGAIGDDVGRGRRVINAEDLVLAPGFIDIHTHLDAQVLWDPKLSPSSWHGVTTAVMGNCGFSLAPTRSEHRERMIATLENVEGMDANALRQGLGTDWGFTTFESYLDRLDRLPLSANVGVLVGHTAIRLFVMGESATEREASPNEINDMASLVQQAMEAGALGVSTSKVPSHVGYGGRPVASRLASYGEILELARPVAGRGVFMCSIGPGLSIPQLASIADETGVDITFGGILANMGGIGGHNRILEQVESVLEGRVIVPQVSCRPVLMDYGLADPYPLTNAIPSIMRIGELNDLFGDVYAARSSAERLVIYRDPAFQRQFKDRTDSDGWHQMMWANTTVLFAPGFSELEQRSVQDIAAEWDMHPSEVVLRLSIASNLEARFSIGFLNGDELEVEKLLRHPATQVALSDAGAHVNQICDAAFTTHLLGHWVREREALTLETAVQMLTSRPADLFKLRDRGRISEGAAADLVLFDPVTVGASLPRRVSDLPAGAPRLVSDAKGIEYVIVNGVISQEQGHDTGMGSGTLLRSGQSANV